MVLQVCFRRDCNCEPGHVLLVSLTPSQPHFPDACLHLHLCTYAPLYVEIFWKTDPNTLRHLCNIKYVIVCVWLHVCLAPLWMENSTCSHLCALSFFPFLCHPPVRLLSCLTRVFVSSSEEIENTTCHRLFGELSLVLYGRMFIILSL